MPAIPIWAYLVIAGLIAASSFAAGLKVEGWHRDSLDRAALVDAVDHFKKEGDRQAAAAKSYADKEASIRAETRTIVKRVTTYVDRPVYRAECIDADGLRDINAALTGQASTAGQPDPAVRPAGRARGPDGRGPDPQADRGGGAIPRVPSPAR